MTFFTKLELSFARAVETVEHLYQECRTTETFWEQTSTWLLTFFPKLPDQSFPMSAVGIAFKLIRANLPHSSHGNTLYALVSYKKLNIFSLLSQPGEKRGKLYRGFHKAWKARRTYSISFISLLFSVLTNTLVLVLDQSKRTYYSTYFINVYSTVVCKCIVTVYIHFSFSNFCRFKEIISN